MNASSMWLIWNLFPIHATDMMSKRGFLSTRFIPIYASAALSKYFIFRQFTESSGFACKTDLRVFTSAKIMKSSFSATMSISR